jgi:hypothetical protein
MSMDVRTQYPATSACSISQYLRGSVPWNASYMLQIGAFTGARSVHDNEPPISLEEDTNSLQSDVQHPIERMF